MKQSFAKEEIEVLGVNGVGDIRKDGGEIIPREARRQILLKRKGNLAVQNP